MAKRKRTATEDDEMRSIKQTATRSEEKKDLSACLRASLTHRQACGSYAQAGAGRSDVGSLLFVSDQTTTTDDAVIRRLLWQRATLRSKQNANAGSEGTGSVLFVHDPSRATEDKVMRRFSGQRGYTLVELMVILSVMLILASLAIPSFMSLRDRAKLNEAEQAMQDLRMAQALYQQSHTKMYFAASTDELHKFTNVTTILQGFLGAPTTLPIVVLNTDTGVGYTITAQAKDSQNTPVTATEAQVLP